MGEGTEHEQDPGDRPSYVVGIGGSAGSLQSLRTLVSGLSETSGAAFVVATHRPREGPSMLREILAGESALPVEEAAEGEPLRANRVYIVPGGEHWHLDPAEQFRGPKADNEGSATGAMADILASSHYPVDALFRSVARLRGERGIGVILSGSGTDGTLGVKAIQDHVGHVLVEDPDTAASEGMPRSPVATGLVDWVLPADRLAPTLMQNISASEAPGASHTPNLDAETLASIGAIVNQHTGRDLSGYKRTTVTRRVAWRNCCRWRGPGWASPWRNYRRAPTRAMPAA